MRTGESGWQSMPSNQASPTRCKYLTGYSDLFPSGGGNGKAPCEKFPQENYKVIDTLYSNRRRSESSMALEVESENRDFKKVKYARPFH